MMLGKYGSIPQHVIIKYSALTKAGKGKLVLSQNSKNEMVWIFNKA